MEEATAPKESQTKETSTIMNLRGNKMMRIGVIAVLLVIAVILYFLI